MPAMPAFKNDFTWGVAAASYQIEGAARTGGRGPSVWDTMCDWPGKVFRGHTGDVACDHYHRFRDDAKLIAGSGASAYRLSIAWPRVMPEGTGTVNEEGLAFYDQLVDALLEQGVTPWVTLFHWDFPSALMNRGGWLNRDVVDWFGDYTRAVVDRLSDRVTHWFTLNEPACFVGLGHAVGEHAPGLKMPISDILRIWHHAMLAHGRAVDILREHARQPAKIGAAPVGSVHYPADNDPALAADCAASTFTIEDYRKHGLWVMNHALMGDPALLGRYPESMLTQYGDRMPSGFEADLAQIHRPLDFYGMNLYSGEPQVRSDDPDARNGLKPAPEQPGSPTTQFHWNVTPDAIYWAVKFIQDRYDLPIYITENGLASMDWVHADGQVHDAGRIDFLTRYLCRLRDAATEGVDVRGYFQWSIMDNFEWAEGYRMRFGLVYVDYATQERIPKDSYHWYRTVAESNGAVLPEAPAPLR